ncbi:MAG: flagellar export chaperone FliS [Proteobacteria bacterium]|nr:flagellar export chaperone FliS [Pseudomonadota bacterium]
MFATAVRSSTSLYQRQAGAYNQVAVSTGVGGASAHGLIGMLYDGLMESMAQARGAMRSKSVDAKHRAIRRALAIVDDGLRAGLNLEAGGQLAAGLNDLYAYVTLRLTHANLHNDESAIDECVRLIEPLRSAWAQIGDQAPI